MSEKLKNAARVFYVIAVCAVLAVPTVKLTAQETYITANAWLWE